MKRMKLSSLQQIFRAFERVNRVWEGEGAEGGAGGGGGASTATEGSESGSEGAADSGASESPAGGASEKGTEPVFDSETYIGDVKLNPEQRPLKKFNRNGMSKQDIDKLLQEAGSELFMTAEEIAEAEKAKGEEGDKKGKEGKDAEKDGKKTEKSDKKGEETAEKDLDPKDFFEKTGLTQKEFDVLPPKTQENLAKYFEEYAQSESKIKAAEQSYKTLKTDTDAALNDPVVAARMEELATGKAFIAAKITPFTEADLLPVDKLLALDKKGEAAELLNKMLQDRAGDAIKHERAVLDRKVADTKARVDAHSVIQKMGEIDPRLSVKDSDFARIVPGHKDFKVMNEIIEFCKKNDMTVMQITKLGPDKLYKLIASEKGWDKDRETSIYEKGKQSLLDKLKNPTKVRALDPGKRTAPIAKTGKEQSAMTQEALVEEIADGNMSNWERLLEAADGNPRRIAELGKIREQGVAKYKENRRGA